jgi:GNAT superfamily N-acetyltransferase
MPPLDLRLIPLAETRALRRDVLRPYMTVDELAEHEPGEAVAFGVYQGDELGDWRIRGMATAPHARGRGAGTKVLQALVEHAISHGATRLWCNARTPARSLYERAGFEATSDEFETPRIGPHYRMELQTRQDG